MALAPGTRLGAYEVVSLLGAGGMGEVYRARDTKLGREVAVKVRDAAHGVAFNSSHPRLLKCIDSVALRTKSNVP